MRVTGTRSRARLVLAAVAAGLLVGVLADGSLALSDVAIRVEATANPWAAGQADSPAIGTLPAGIVVPDGKTNVFFPLVSGSWSNAGAMFSADGERPAAGAEFDCGGPPPCTVLASNGLSGLIDAARFWYLTGVFIGPGTPAGGPPPSIDFTLRHDFTVLEPALGQVFFIGDGRAAGGDVHLFRVPAGSTRLFLGMVDICAPDEIAGCYYDNSGSLEVMTSWGSTPDTATLPAPAAPGHGGTGILLAAAGVAAFLIALRLDLAPDGRGPIPGGSRVPRSTSRDEPPDRGADPAERERQEGSARGEPGELEQGYPDPGRGGDEPWDPTANVRRDDGRGDQRDGRDSCVVPAGSSGHRPDGDAGGDGQP